MEYGNYKIYKLDDICYALDEKRIVMKGKEKTPTKQWCRKGYYSTAKAALKAVADHVAGDNLTDVKTCIAALADLQKQLKESN